MFGIYSVTKIGILPWAVFAVVCFAQSSPLCPLLGPSFPAPGNTSTSPIIQNALSNLQSTIKDLVGNGTLPSANTTFHLSIFSSDCKLLNYSYIPPNFESYLTSGTVDENTIFRIGSVSKLFTVYTILAEVGEAYLNDPITKWIPELKQQAYNGDSVDDVQWEKITLRALASQLAGINRDLSLGDLDSVLNSTTAEFYGLPSLTLAEIGTCGTSPGLTPCTREEYFNQLQSLHPITSPFNTPIYSNMGFVLLAYAFEGITGRPFNVSLEQTLLQPLNLTRTSAEPPLSKDNSVIPVSEIVSWWNLTLGDSSPMGGIFSTGADLTKLCQSILKSELLDPALTRAWLKPASLTSALLGAVGMPWEISRLLVPLTPGSSSTRVVDAYSKDGALGLYQAMVTLNPDYDMGIAILSAGTIRQETLGLVNGLATDILVPAFEEAAREQAKDNFAGIYTNYNISMSLTLSIEDSYPGIGVSNWTLNGTDLLQAYGSVAGVLPPLYPSLRLYPMALVQAGKVRFRGVFEVDPKSLNSSTASQIGDLSSCVSWGGVDGVQYHNVGFDDFDIEVDGLGRATAVVPRVTRQTLLRGKRENSKYERSTNSRSEI